MTWIVFSTSRKSKMHAWLQQMLDHNLVPYVATTEQYLPHLNLSILGENVSIKLLERAEDRVFHRAYLLANSLAFGSPSLKMPNWVYIDCVLMQSAVIGFMLPRDLAPSALLDFFRAEEGIEFDKLDFIPVSGQIAGLAIDGQTLVGFSLFSLRRYFQPAKMPELAFSTKYAALSAYKADQRNQFLGISQYNNPALRIHSLFGEKMYIAQPTMPLHPLGHMSFVYKMHIRLDEPSISARQKIKEPGHYDFLLRADDEVQKQNIQERMAKGEKFIINPPVHITKEQALYLPISAE